MKVTGDQIVESLRKTEILSNCSHEAVERYENFVRNTFAEAVADRMDDTLDLKTLMDLKKVYIDLSLQTEALPEGADPEELADLVSDLGDFFDGAMARISEEDFESQTLAMMDIRPEIRERIFAKDITVGEFLIACPETIFEGPMGL